MPRRVPTLKIGAVSGCVVLLVFLFGCSGGSSPQQTTSGFPQRAFVSNAESGSVQIVNSRTDVLDLASSINVGTSPGLMALAPNRQFTLVFNAGGNTISVVNNTQESQATTITLPAWTESLAVSPDSSQGYVAMPAAAVLGQPAGMVDVLDLVNNRVKYSLNIPGAHWLVVNHSGNRLLVFSDNSNAVTVINTTLLGKAGYATTVNGFDRPVWGVFSDDDSTAYILSCGSECGGGSAAVTVLHMSTTTAGATVGVSGATQAMLINGNLYVAGSGHGVGTLQVVSTQGLFASPPIGISNGYHWRMELGSNSKLFVGARGCTQTGCLSILDIPSNKVVTDVPFGDVTGIAPIPGRNIVYVIEGGELRIFDTTTSAVSSTQFLDIVGQAVDVKEIDPAAQ